MGSAYSGLRVIEVTLSELAGSAPRFLSEHETGLHTVDLILTLRLLGLERPANAAICANLVLPAICRTYGLCN